LSRSRTENADGLPGSDYVRVIGYVRLSSDERHNTGAGQMAQEQAIRAECRRRGWELVSLERDNGFSGSDLRRPAITRTLLALEKKQADCLMVAKLDRLSRSLFDFASLMERASRERWSLLALDLPVDTSTPSGEAMALVLSTFAQFERRRIGQRVRDARLQLRATSRSYGTPPYGFTRAGKRLVPDPGEQQVVAWAWSLYNKDQSFHGIAQQLNAKGLRGKLGGAWTGESVCRVLHLSQTVGMPLDQVPAPPRPNPISFPTPYGYERVGGRLVRDPVEQAMIARIRRSYRRGLSLSQIAERLTAEKVPTKRGGSWSPSHVLKLIRGDGVLRERERAKLGQRAPQLERPEGYMPFRTAPYGWRRAGSRLVEQAKEQAAIARMRELREEGLGQYRIAARLTAEGFPTRHGRDWNPGTVNDILRNRGTYRQQMATGHRR
jgi:DNA invertase Pin-like site-specific DNA recombinase